MGRALFRNIGAGGVREGGEHDHAAARQERLPRFGPHRRAQAARGDDRLLARGVAVEERDPVALSVERLFRRQRLWPDARRPSIISTASPSKLTISQAAMLAGLVKAPSKLAPTGNLKGARDAREGRAGAMVDAGVLTKAQADAVQPARAAAAPGQASCPTAPISPTGCCPRRATRAGDLSQETDRHDDARPAAAEGRRARGRSARACDRRRSRSSRCAPTAASSRWSAARITRPARSTARPRRGASRDRRSSCSSISPRCAPGMTPDDMIEDEPVTIGGWSPKNSDGRYEGQITLRRAFQKSSNVAAARLIQKVGVDAVIKAARDLGISTPIAARGDDRARHLDRVAARTDQRLCGGRGRRLSGRRARDRRRPTTRAGTTGWSAARSRVRRQRPRRDARSAVRLGDQRHRARGGAVGPDLWQDRDDAGQPRRACSSASRSDLVVGVWVGNDDNTPQSRPVGRRRAARVWQDFMQQALGIAPPPPPPSGRSTAMRSTRRQSDDRSGNRAAAGRGQIEGLGINLQVKSDGTISHRAPRPTRDDRPPGRTNGDERSDRDIARWRPRDDPRYDPRRPRGRPPDEARR